MKSINYTTGNRIRINGYSFPPIPPLSPLLPLPRPNQPPVFSFPGSA